MDGLCHMADEFQKKNSPGAIMVIGDSSNMIQSLQFTYYNIKSDMSSK